MIKITGLTRLKDVIISSGIVPPTNNGPVYTSKLYAVESTESLGITVSGTEIRPSPYTETGIGEAVSFVPQLTRLSLPPEISATPEAVSFVPQLTRLDFSINYDRYKQEALTLTPVLTEITLA